MRFLRFFLMIVTLTLYVCPVYAITPIPEESGFSGFVSLGTTVMSLESNLVAGNVFGGVAQKTIPSINEKPDSETKVQPAINGELRYTFGSTRTQIIAGTMIEDFLSFDFGTIVGVRQDVPHAGIIGVSYLFSGMPAEVWEDPYLENTSRKEAERDSAGVRLSWEKIFGTMFHAKYSYREIEIENELSGTDPSLGLSADEIMLLDRDGEVHNAELAYLYRIGAGHLLNTAFKYNRHGRDGGAMSKDQYGVQLTYTKKIEKFLFITNASYSFSEYDEENPIYSKTQENDNYGLALSVLYMKPFDLENWSIMTNVAGYKETSNIDFYEAQAAICNLSAIYRF